MKKKTIQLSDHFTYQKIGLFCVSPIIMMVFVSIYGVVDGLFVSNYVGKTSFAAINLVMPFIMILGGIGFMIGTGGSALVAKTLGEGKKDLANRYFTMMVYLAIICGVVCAVIGFVFMRPISYLLGATEDMIEDCVTYGRITMIFLTAFSLQNVFQTFLTTAEKPKLGLTFTVVAGVSNMVLDYLFIARFHWGVAGAAFATGISEFFGAFLPLLYFLEKNDSLLHLTHTRLEGRPLVKACFNGSSELMSNISSSIVSMLYNFQLLRYAGEDGVAAYGVLMYIQFIFTAMFIGYTVGISPVVSYHYGAGNTEELKSLHKKSILLNMVAGVLMMVLAFTMAGPLAKLFVGYDRTLYGMTRHAFMIFSFVFILRGFNIFASAFFTALNNGGVSAAISFLRTLVFQTLSVLILPLLFGLEGIWWAVTVAEFFAFVISVIFLAAKRKTYHYA